MELKVLEERFTVCKVRDDGDVYLGGQFVFVGKTDEEISLMCETGSAPEDCVEREDGWRGFRIEGMLDFSLTGIIAKISGLLAEAGIGIFVMSTYNTDYVLVKEGNLDKAVNVLGKGEYVFV